MGWFSRFIAALRSRELEPIGRSVEPDTVADPVAAPEADWPETHNELDEPATPEPVAQVDTAELDDELADDWLDELDQLLDQAGVSNFTAKELTHLPKALPKPRSDMPPRELWANLVAVAKLAQKVRDLYGEPLWVSTCWRPDWYNAAVGGAPKSQHIHAKAIDLNPIPSSRTPARIRRLEQATATVWDEDPTARGFGVYAGGRTHIDVGGGRRTWGEAKRVLKELE